MVVNLAIQDTVASTKQRRKQKQDRMIHQCVDYLFDCWREQHESTLRDGNVSINIFPRKRTHKNRFMFMLSQNKNSISQIRTLLQSRINEATSDSSWRVCIFATSSYPGTVIKCSIQYQPQSEFSIHAKNVTVGILILSLLFYVIYWLDKVYGGQV